jgi:hypothetical protein
MTKINFDEPSEVKVTADDPILKVRNTGNGVGIQGESHGAHSGVHGISVNGGGVSGKSTNFWGVFGESDNSIGVVGKYHGQAAISGIDGQSTNGAGVSGKSWNSWGVFGESDGKAPDGIGVFGRANVEGGVGVLGRGILAGRFEGNVEVTGDISLLNADCAEDFDTSSADNIQPGTVMILSEDGVVESSQHAYDKKVAGVISGAGGYKPGIVLGRQDSQSKRIPIALMGKVYSKVDASYSSIGVGDLLTTSNTIGHAMKAADPLKAFGAVIGKALRPLKTGKGLIPILIALQ